MKSRLIGLLDAAATAGSDETASRLQLITREVQLLAQVLLTLESHELAVASEAGVKPLHLSDRDVEAELSQALRAAWIKA